MDTVEAPGTLGSDTTPRWAVHPHGHMVVGSSREYLLEIRRTDGKTVRIRMPHSPVPLSDADLRRMAPQLRAIERADGGRASSTAPSHKWVLDGFLFDPEGLVWVRRPVPTPGGAPPPPNPMRAPCVFDVLTTDGAYGGSVAFPLESRVMAFSDGRAYVVEKGEMDEQYVVRYRIRGLEHP